METKLVYKGYTIEIEMDLWAVKYSGAIRYYRDERIHNARTFEEAIEEIDYRVMCEESKIQGKGLDTLVPFFLYIATIITIALWNL